MTIRHLQVFIAVAETGTMSEAATRLYISQPTVSQTIRELEEEGEVRLFERLGKRLHITDAGVQLLAHARKVLEAFKSLERSFTKGGLQESIRVGGTMTIGTCLMAMIMQDFHGKYPDIETFSYIGNTRIIEDKLLRSELDVALVEGQVTHPSLVTIPMIDDCLLLACSLDHPFAKKKELRVEDLEGQPFVMREKGSGTRELFENFLRSYHVDIQVKWEASCPETIRSAIFDCGCMACISARLLERDIREQRLHVFAHSAHGWDRSFSFVYHKDKVFSPAMLNLQKIIANYRFPDFLKVAKISRLLV